MGSAIVQLHMFLKFQPYDYLTEIGKREAGYRLSLTVDKTERLNEVPGNRVRVCFAAGMAGL
jgi:hypothetical protein